MISIKLRESWRAKPRKGTPSYMGSPPVSQVYYHWTGTPRPARSDIEWLRSIQMFHMEHNGWADFAYSYAIGMDGTVYEGRGGGIQGAHTLGFNKVSYGILFLIGTDEELTTAAIDSSLFLLQYLEQECFITPQTNVFPHSAVSQGNQCPGDEVRKLIKWTMDDGWWATAPTETKGSLEVGHVSAELENVYLDIRGERPGEYARVWQDKLDAGHLTLNDIRWKLLPSALDDLRQAIKDLS